MTLDNNCTFNELLEYFNSCDFPNTLKSWDSYYTNPRESAMKRIKTIENIILKHGQPHKTENREAKEAFAVAKWEKIRLFCLYKALQIKENWNKPMDSLI